MNGAAPTNEAGGAVPDEGTAPPAPAAPVLIAHLSDLHLKTPDDLSALGVQLDRIVARNPAHLAITGDVLDRWDPRLLDGVLDALAARDLLHADRLTILHGNHDLGSSGGHPRRTADLWRLVLRCWDPPPIVLLRRRKFYAAIEKRAPGVAAKAPFLKRLSCGWRIAVVDTVPVFWRPLTFSKETIIVRHAVGCVRQKELAWLSACGDDGPLMLLVHHFPMEALQFNWTPRGKLRHLVREIRVPMEIPGEQLASFWRAATAAGTRLILCGHVHRARLEWKDRIAVGLNGQSGADWAGRTIAYYDISREPLEQVQE